MLAINEKRLITPDDLAKRLGVGRECVLRWHRIGKLPSIKIAPRVVRFDLDAVLKAIGAI